MIRVLFVCLMWGVALFKSEWRHWEKFQSTILFMIAGNFMIGLITYNYTLWDLSSELGGHIVNDFLICLLFFPPAMMVYLTHYTKTNGFIRKAIYISSWALILTFIEGIEYLFDNIHYEHKWNLFKSALVNIVMLSTLSIHYKKPLLAYLLFLIEAILLLIICKIPIVGFK